MNSAEQEEREEMLLKEGWQEVIQKARRAGLDGVTELTALSPDQKIFFFNGMLFLLSALNISVERVLNYFNSYK